MATSAPASIARGIVLFSPFVLVPAALFASLPWLRQQNTAFALGIAAAAGILVMGYALFLAARVNRRLDEVEVAGQRFAQSRGWTIGIFVTALLLLFPPVTGTVADLANTVAGGSPEKAVRVGVVMGFMLLAIVQTLGIIGSAIWWQQRLK